MMKSRIIHLDEVDSTNTEALRHAKLGAEEGLTVIARSQTAGRGRFDRVWVSEPDAGLYMSIILRPKSDISEIPLITLLAGVAVHQTLEDLGINGDIKWVNDVLVDEKKICGILAETTESPSGLAVVVGIGVNLRPGNFHPEIAGTSTSVESLTGNRLSPTEFAQSLLERLSLLYRDFATEMGREKILMEWKSRSSYSEGKNVTVTIADASFQGITRGIEPNGALRVEKTDGTMIIVSAGEIERLRQR
jgi:BirA family transcriptional regulator, biotin operon repressor / biotin---[acetyl-CoA-carboxylase] ligase